MDVQQGTTFELTVKVKYTLEILQRLGNNLTDGYDFKT